MAVENIEVAITREGLIEIAKLIAIGVTDGVLGTTNFKVGFFRLANLGDGVNKKVYRDSCDEIYYMDYSAVDFATAHELDGNLTEPIAINSIQYIAPVAPDTIGTVEIVCYVSPAQGTSFTCNEIMVYTGDGTVGNPYKSFIYGVFPAISKQVEYGINLTITCQF